MKEIKPDIAPKTVVHTPDIQPTIDEEYCVCPEAHMELVISKMIDTIFVGGLDIYYGGVPFDYIFKGVFSGYMHYYIAFCLVTAGTYYLIGKLKRNKI